MRGDIGSDGCAFSEIPACNEPPREEEGGDLAATLECCLSSPHPCISIYTALIFFPLTSSLSASLLLLSAALSNKTSSADAPGNRVGLSEPRESDLGSFALGCICSPF